MPSVLAASMDRNSVRVLRNPVAVNAVGTTFRIVEYMAAYGGSLGISEIARGVDAQRPLVFRHLRTLVELGYAAQDPVSEKYSLTPRLFHLGQCVAEQIDLLAAARPVAFQLTREVKLAASIGQIEPQGVRILDLLRYPSSIEITTPPGTLFDFVTSAQGKVALAFTPGLWVRRLAEEQEAPRPDRPRIDAGRLVRELDLVRQRGWSISSGEALVGVSALAAPIFDGQANLAGTFALIGSSQMIPEPPPSETVAKLVGAARRISEQLGYRGKEAIP